MPSARSRRQGGAATIEFYIAAFFVFIPLMMAVLQMGMFIVAKNTVNVAALATARAGAASGGDRAEMRRAYATALAPLYSATGLRVLGGRIDDVGTGDYPAMMGAAYAAALADITATFSSFRSLNPTAGAFRDFGIVRGGQTIIPVTGLETSNPVGGNSRQRRSDALLLKVEVRHCYVMVFPIVDQMVTAVLRRMNASVADQMCFARDGVPIVSQAVVRMTVPPVAANFR